MAARIKKGDTVMMLTGNDRNRTGTVISVDRARGTAVVEGLRIAIRHEKQTANTEGGRKPVEMPIDMSNLSLLDPDSNRPTRVGFRFENGRKVRYSKRSGKTLDD